MSDKELELQLANFKLDVLQEIISLLPEGGNSRETLDFIMNRLFSLVEMEGASLILPDDTGENLVFQIVRGSKEAVLTGLTMDAGKGIAGKVFKSGIHLLLDDTTKDKDFHKDIDEALGYETKSLIAVPVKACGKVLGVLEGVNLDVAEIQTPGQLTSLFESISDIIAAVLVNENLMVQLDKEASFSRLLLDISRTVNSNLEIADVLNVVMSIAKRLLKVEASSLLLVDDHKTQLYFYVAHGEKRKMLDKKVIPMDRGVAGWCARTGQGAIVNDVASDERFDRSIDRETGFNTRSILGTPMEHAGKILGVLEVINKEDGTPFDETDLNLLSTIANESAVAVKNSLLMNDKETLFSGAVRALARAVNAKDEYEAGHSERVSFYAEQIGKCLRPDDWELHRLLSIAGLIHDVGKIGIPDSILLKSGRLNDAERAIIETHSQLSHDIIQSLGVEDCLEAVLHHHERFDGSGYPEHLKGEEIPLSSRILAVADSFAAITSDRPYRAAKTHEEAAQIINSNSDRHYDPEILDAFNVAVENNLLSDTES